MPNRIFTELLNEQIRALRDSFSRVSRNVFYDQEKGQLIHPGEFGMYREAIFQDFLQFLVPRRLAFDTGFLINANDEVSNQCDIIIFDAHSTPLIQSGARQRFFPIETVCSVGEIKSVLTKDLLSDALIKLSRLKAMREQIPHPVILKGHPSGFNPQTSHYDQLFTFLICERFDFDTSIFMQDKIGYQEHGVPHYHRHNLILSLDDGIVLYYDENGKSMMYPIHKGKELKTRIVTPGEDPDIHIKYFAVYIFLGTSSTTILYPDMADYLSEFSGGFNLNQP